MTEQNAEFAAETPASEAQGGDIPTLSAEELAIVSPPVEEPLVLDDPVSDASGDGGSGPAGDKPAEAAPAAEEPEAPKTVPLATHIDERRALQAKLEERDAAHQAQIAALLERLSPAPVAEAEVQADPMPDPVTDTAGFERWLSDRQSKALEAVEAQKAEFAEAQMFHTAQSQEVAFKQATPDYEAAFTHLRSARATELQLTTAMSPEQIQQQVNSEIIALSKDAVSKGRNAPDTIYKLAAARGYVKAEEAPATEAPAETAPAAPSTVDQIKAAQAASKSIGNAPGGQAASLTAAAIANMSEAELAALDDKAFERAMS